MQVSVLGDFSSLCAAVALVGYLVVGQRLRAWMPIFLYSCPVTGKVTITVYEICQHIPSSKLISHAMGFSRYFEGQLSPIIHRFVGEIYLIVIKIHPSNTPIEMSDE